MPGLESIPLRIPDRWDPVWFESFVREVLAKADARNAIPGIGITIEGTPDEPATISANDAVGQLADQAYVLTESSDPPDAIANARVLRGSAAIEIVDFGPGQRVEIRIRDGSISGDMLRAAGECTVLGRATNEVGPMGDIYAEENDTLLRRVDDELSFGQLTLEMAPDGLWTYEKIQDVSETSRVLGRKSAGEGPIEELTLTDILDFVDSAADGDMLVRVDGEWTRLPAGSDGEVLMMVNGVPTWVTPPWAPADATFATVDDETANLPNSRRLVAGTAISFDTSTPGEIEISTP